MSANVALSDTFDQWRMKTNEWISMTNLAGSSNSIKLANTTDSSSNTTGSITTAGGLAAISSVVVGENLTLFGAVDAVGTTNLDAVDIDGATQIDGAVTVGVDDTGYDVKFFGATSGQFLLWDASADDLILSSDTFLNIEGTRVSTSSTTGSFRTAGGVGIAKKLFVGEDVDVNGTTNLDVVDIDGATQIDATLSVGVNDTGYDVKFFGATASAYLLWDQSADDLILAGAAAISIDATTDASSTTTGSFHTDGGAGIAGKLFVGTDLDVNGTTNLDAVDIDGAVQLDATLSVGVNDTGYNVKLFGATSGAYLLWDQANDDLVIAGGAAISIDATTDSSSTTTGSFHTDGGAGIAGKLFVGTDLDVNGTTNLDAVDIDGAVQIDATLSVGVNDTGADVKFFGATAGKYWLWDESADKTIQVSDSQLTGELTVGVDDTGHDVIFYGAAAGALMMWDQSEDSLLVRGASADAAGSSGRIVLQTAQTDVRDADIIGRIDWNAVAEHSTDGNDVGASIWAEADATFSATVNSTDLVFATGDSGVATEKFRIDSTGQATFADGAIDVNIASHDGTNGLKLGGTLLTATAAELNDFSTSTSTIGKAIAMAMIFGE